MRLVFVNSIGRFYAIETLKSSQDDFNFYYKNGK